MVYKEAEIQRGKLEASPGLQVIEETLARMAGSKLDAVQSHRHDWVDADSYLKRVVADRDVMIEELDALLRGLRKHRWLGAKDLPSFRIAIDVTISDERGDRSTPIPVLPTIAGAAAMNEPEFWDLIGKLAWKEAGDDEAVCRPLVEALSAKPVSAIEAFEEILTQKLHALDTEAHAREIGEEAYTGPDDHFSVDWFLYVRCCVVANGQRTFESVLKNPKKMPKDKEFEALLQVAAEAYQQKMGQDFTFTPSVSYETFSNKAGWKR